MPENKRIIWVDDDNHHLMPQRNNLTEIGYDVVIKSNVDEAIDVLTLEKQKLAGVIIDVMMNPGDKLRHRAHLGGLKTGLILIEYLHEAELLLQEKVFIFTHRIDPEAQDWADQLGVKYYLKQDYKGKKICDLVRREFGE